MINRVSFNGNGNTNGHLLHDVREEFLRVAPNRNLQEVCDRVFGGRDGIENFRKKLSRLCNRKIHSGGIRFARLIEWLEYVERQLNNGHSHTH